MRVSFFLAYSPIVKQAESQHRVGNVRYPSVAILKYHTTASEMSNESAAIEVTLLHRPVRQNSADVSSSSLLLVTSRDVENRYRDPNHNCNDIGGINCSCSNGYHTNTTVATSTTVAIANLNNNNVKVRTGAGFSGESSNDHVSKTIKMDHNKRVLYRIALDVFILLCGKSPLKSIWPGKFK